MKTTANASTLIPGDVSEALAMPDQKSGRSRSGLGTHRDVMPDALWDARDVAAYLKVSRSWVYQRSENGTLPSVRIGGLRRFVPEQIRAFAVGDSPGLHVGARRNSLR
jgi:excisionase family DNA binding protein